jgi:hypothetical protein
MRAKATDASTNATVAFIHKDLAAVGELSRGWLKAAKDSFAERVRLVESADEAKWVALSKLPSEWWAARAMFDRALPVQFGLRIDASPDGTHDLVHVGPLMLSDGDDEREPDSCYLSRMSIAHSSTPSLFKKAIGTATLC